MYTTQTKQHGLAIPLTKPQLAQAIQAYRHNPNAFKGVPMQALEVMGLNPNMATGRVGAVKES
jgi:hypothetical protein